MDTKRKNEIIENLKEIEKNYNEESDLTMFTLISRYNSNYNNKELIGGKFVRNNIPELSDLK